MSELLIDVTNVTVGYDERIVLDCPALRVFSDAFIGITGPNGGGKTTLVKVLLKSIPYEGNVLYSKTLTERGAQKIGYLPQVHAIDRSFPIEVFEVVLSGLQAGKGLLKKYLKSDRERAEAILEFAGIKSLKNKPIGKLSGGEFQRVMLCRALVSDPPLLILDEPDNFVDHAFEQEFYRLLAQLAEQKAIILVSHNLDAVKNLVKTVLCVDRTVILKNS